MSQERNSNIELLRIICMFFVVLLHFNNHGVNINIICFQGELSLQNTLGHLVESFAIVAVNCFVLISGYYGLSFKLKSLLKLYLQCFFMGLVGYLLYVLLSSSNLEYTKLLARVFAFSRNRYWFIYAYLCLYFIAPLLNYAIKSMNKVQFGKSLVLFSLFLFYFSYIRDVGENRIGMSYIQFVLLYLVGRYIGLYFPIEKIIRYRYKWLLGYVCTTLLVFSLAIFVQYSHISLPFLRPYPYNSILVVASSCFLLLFMLSKNFYNKIINYISTSVLAVYLLQENPYFGFNILYPFTEQYFQSLDSVVMKYATFFIGSCVFFFVAIMIDKVGFYLTKPIQYLYEVYVSPKIEPIISRYIN